MQQVKNKQYLINICKMNDSKDKSNISLEDVYKKMMGALSFTNFDFSKWEKTGDVYKQFSIYDTSKYETISSSNIIINK